MAKGTTIKDILCKSNISSLSLNSIQNMTEQRNNPVIISIVQ